jgi:hypothetical protein
MTDVLNTVGKVDIGGREDGGGKMGGGNRPGFVGTSAQEAALIALLHAPSQ